MSTIKVDAVTLSSMGEAYAQLAASVANASAYLASHCTLSDASGLLLYPLEPKYSACFDVASGTVASVCSSLSSLSGHVAGALSDAHDLEATIQGVVQEFQKELGDTPPPGLSVGGGGSSNAGTTSAGATVAATVPTARASHAVPSAAARTGTDYATASALDPLGRSAAELQAAWEGRERLQIPVGGPAAVADSSGSAPALRLPVLASIVAGAGQRAESPGGASWAQ